MSKLGYLSIFFFLLLINTSSVFAVSIPEKFSDFKVLANGESFTIPKEELDKWFIEKPYIVNTTDYMSEIENTRLIVQKDVPYELISTIKSKFYKKKLATFDTDDKKIQLSVESIANQIQVLPVNSELSITEDKKVIIAKPHVNGLDVDIEESVKIIEKDLKNKKILSTLSLKENLAKIRSDNFLQLGLKEIIGEGRSNFSGSTRNRIHNIKTAASKFKGLLIPPNKEFSFLDNLGPVDGENGYKKELVIRNNQTIPEYGGGTCQVSTTIFRAAVLTGMKITARKNHSYPVHYYLPTGFDATVYIPAPDMKFVNNTDNYILIDTILHGNELVFQFYGTDDGRNVEMKGPIVTERNTDGSMKTYFVQKVFDKNGNLVINDTFYSNYKSPDDYPQPGQEKFTEKPKDWSKKQWKFYKQKHNL